MELRQWHAYLDVKLYTPDPQLGAPIRWRRGAGGSRWKWGIHPDFACTSFEVEIRLDLRDEGSLPEDCVEGS